MGKKDIEAFNSKIIRKGLVKRFNSETLNNIKSADIEREIISMYSYLHSKSFITRWF